MRFDMHCHTKEGSLDGKVTLRDYVLRLKILGYDGMLVTDHDSYKAWRWYTRNSDDPVFKDFTILKGIEYDTCDGGHILVIMPSDVNFPILEFRGLPVRLLIELVHAFHGILGPAHPTGEKYLSITNGKYYHKHPEVLGEFDFIETYNSCITEEANERAAEIAEEYGLPCFAGSDSHKLDNIGLAYTDFDQPILSEDDLIEYIKTSPSISCGGEHYSGTSRDHLGIFYDFLLRLWYLYNLFNNMRRTPKRIAELTKMALQSNNVIQRLRNLEIAGLFQDMVQSSHHKRTVRREVKRLAKASPDNVARILSALDEENIEEILSLIEALGLAKDNNDQIIAIVSGLEKTEKQQNQKRSSSAVS